MAVLLVLLVFLSLRYECGCACVLKYTEIEKKFLSNEGNIERLQDVFFPVNGKSTNFAVVNYFYYDSQEIPVECSYNRMLDSHQLYHVAHKFEEHCYQPSSSNVSSFCHWLWTNCAIFVLYSPRDLQILAYTVNMLLPQVRTNLTSTVSLEVEHICDNVTYNHLLKLTARLKALATGKNDSFTQPELKGYATKELFTYINYNKDLSELRREPLLVVYFVIRYSIYAINTIGTLLFIPLIAITARKLYPYIYDGIQASPLYYAVLWGLGLTSFVLNIIIILINFLITVLPACVTGFTATTVYLILMPAVEFVSVFFVPLKNDIRTPKCLWFLACGFLLRNSASKIIQRFALWNVFVLVQLLVFHAIFFFIAFFYWPLLSTGVLIANALIVFCTVSLIGLLLLIELLLRPKHGNYAVTDIWLAVSNLIKAFLVGGILYCLTTTLIGFALESSTLRRILLFVCGPLVATVILAAVHWVSSGMHQ